MPRSFSVDASGRVVAGGAAAGTGNRQAGRPRLRQRAPDRTLFAQDLAELLRAGLSVREALEVLARSLPTASEREAVQRLQADVLTGQSLSQAMAAQQAAFGEVLVALVRASETTSDLPASLERHARAARRLDVLRAHVASSMVYPALVLTVGLGVLTFLLGWVVPRFAEVIAGQAQALSSTAQAMVQFGTFMGRHRGAWLSALVVALGALGSALALPGGRAALWQAAAALPGLRATLGLLHAARFFATTASLTQGGLPAVSAFAMAAPLLLPPARAQLHAALARARQGLPLAQGLDGNAFGDPVVVRLLEVGQRTGDLPAALERIAALLEARTTRRIDRLVKAFEPVMMVLLGAVLGGAVLLMYLPLLELSSALQ